MHLQGRKSVSIVYGYFLRNYAIFLSLKFCYIHITLIKSHNRDILLIYNLISEDDVHKIHGFRDSVPLRKLHACCEDMQ